jgi:hypothetical protein
VATALAEVEQANRAEDYAKAGQILERLLAECGPSLPAQQQDGLRNELAQTRYHLGDEAGCLAALEPLAALAQKTDEQITREGVLRLEDTAERLRIAGAARATLQLCSQPRVENDPSILLGRSYATDGPMLPGLRASSAGAVRTAAGELRLSTWRKVSWRESKRSREKALYALTEFVDPARKPPLAKVLDVLFVDLDKFPAGALQVGDRPNLCTRIGHRDWNVIGVFPAKHAKQGVAPYRAWLADGEKKKFVEQKPDEIRCRFWPEHGD